MSSKILVKNVHVLDCTIDDIMKFVSSQNNEDNEGDASKNI